MSAVKDAGKTGIKICGLFRECDIAYVNEARPDYAGFILHFPKSHRNLTPEVACTLRARLMAGIKAVGVFVDQPEDLVLETADSVGLDVIQLHGSEDNGYIDRIRMRAGQPVWKAFRVRSEADLWRAARCSADGILLDNGYGTGSAFDWSVAAGAGEILRGRKLILAGGLTPDNIPEALRRMRPGIIDLSSGVETNRVKDRDKIRAAVRAVRAGGLPGQNREQGGIG